MTDPPERSDFARIRHDLRTPVNHILGYTEMLLEDEAVPEMLRADLGKIHAGGRALLALIKDYFDDELFAQKRPDPHRMYHELRTPVNHIIGYTELLLEDVAHQDIGELRSDLEKIGAAAASWLALMEEYLLTPGQATAEAGTVSLPPGVRYVVAPAARSSVSAMPKGRVLVVDDDAMNREMLARRLARLGHVVDTAPSGAEALHKLRRQAFDVVLLDLVMPGLDGYQVLQRIKSDPALAETRVIMLSALDEEQGVARCIEAGADDFLPKPFNSVFLHARLGACLEKKAARDREALYLAELRAEREKSERLLLNVLPEAIAGRLKQGETMIADSFDAATVLFADLVGFTPLSRRTPPLALVDLLNEVFSRFDELAAGLGLEKIKTIGDAYMVVAGVPDPRPDHAAAAASLALLMREALASVNAARGLSLSLRIGLHSGPVVAGIIGRNKFSYDLWGDTVNIASRMESSAPLDSIQVSAVTAALLAGGFQLEDRGTVAIKGIGEMETWTLEAGPQASTRPAAPPG